MASQMTATADARAQEIRRDQAAVAGVGAAETSAEGADEEWTMPFGGDPDDERSLAPFEITPDEV